MATSMKNKGTLRISTMVFVLILVFTAAFLCSISAHAASSYKLAKSVKSYYKNGKKWRINVTSTYEYNDQKDPVKITYKGKYTDRTDTFTYTYESGKKTKMNKESNADVPSEATYDAKGRRITEKTDYMDLKFTYNSKNLISKIRYKDGTTNYKYRYYSNKIPRTVRSSGATQAVSNFTKKGYVTHFRSFNMAEPFSDCKYNFNKDGTVKNVIITMQEGSKKYYMKYEFKYTSKKISAVRYRAMVNAILAGESISGCCWY